MTNIVEFPGLGLTLEVNNVAFTIFGLEIYWYGVLIAVGLLLGVIFAFSQGKIFGLDTDRMLEVIIIGVVFAVVIGRLYYVVFSDQEYHSFFDVIDLRAGGIAIYGGIIGGFIGAIVGCKWRKVPILPLFDVASMGLLIGQAIGRWGNFFNQEAFGSNTTSLFGMISPTTTNYLLATQEKLAATGVSVDPYMPVHPTFLYESIWCAVGFLLLFLYRKHRKYNGEIFLLYIAWYGVGRFFIEALRTDSLMIGNTGMRVSQLLAGISALAAIAIWALVRYKRRDKPLMIPEIPPHTAEVKLETDAGVRVFKISWPADQPAPSRKKQQAMAYKMLRKEEGQAAGDAGEPEEAAGEAQESADENLSIEQAGPAEEPAEAQKEEVDGGESH